MTARPTEDAIQKALVEARRLVSFKNWDVDVVRTDFILPREMPMLDPEIPHALEEMPEEVPPVILTPVGNAFLVIDGHHRLAGAVELRMNRVWALIVDQPRFKPHDLRSYEWYTY